MRSSRQILLALLAGLAMGAAWSQTDSDDAGEAPEAVADEAAAESQDDADEIEVDDESYVDIEEEDFRPSEEIDADQSIPFPTDI